MIEPYRQTSLELLVPYVRDRINLVLLDMVMTGWDPRVFETLRSERRQLWLYGIGRTHSLGRRPVTWTLHSLHLVGKAVDIISAHHLWDSPDFFEALDQAARTHGLHTLPSERCHVQWEG
jgi:hypothetical protein